MPSLVAGDTARTLLLLSGPGLAFAPVTSRLGGAFLDWTPTFADLGGGVYEAARLVSAAGLWSWAGRAGDGTPVVVEWRVGPAGTARTAAFRTGETARTLLLLSASGLAFATLASRVGGQPRAWAPAFADLGGGAYEASRALDAAGRWSWAGTAGDGTRLVIEFDALGATVGPQPPLGGACGSVAWAAEDAGGVVWTEVC